MFHVLRARLSRAGRVLPLLPMALFPCRAQAPGDVEAPSRFLVRLDGAMGQGSQDQTRKTALEGGVDLLLSANAFQRYGLRVATLDLAKNGQHQRYLTTGLMIEMVTYGWCRMEIGTLGFVGRGPGSGANPFGLASFVGYERRAGRFNWSIGYDSRIIFARPAIMVNSLGVGLGAHF